MNSELDLFSRETRPSASPPPHPLVLMADRGKGFRTRKEAGGFGRAGSRSAPSPCGSLRLSSPFPCAFSPLLQYFGSQTPGYQRNLLTKRSQNRSKRNLKKGRGFRIRDSWVLGKPPWPRAVPSLSKPRVFWWQRLLVHL